MKRDLPRRANEEGILDGVNMQRCKKQPSRRHVWRRVTSSLCLEHNGEEFFWKDRMVVDLFSCCGSLASATQRATNEMVYLACHPPSKPPSPPAPEARRQSWGNGQVLTRCNWSSQLLFCYVNFEFSFFI